MNNKTNIIISIVALLAISFGLFSLYKGNKEPEMSPEQKYDFLIGCVEEGGSYEYCDCAFDVVEKEIGVVSIIDSGLRLEYNQELTQIQQDAYKKAVIECLKYQDLF